MPGAGWIEWRRRSQCNERDNAKVNMTKVLARNVGAEKRGGGGAWVGFFWLALDAPSEAMSVCCFRKKDSHSSGKELKGFFHQLCSGPQSMLPVLIR